LTPSQAACGPRAASLKPLAYTVPVAILTLKVIQSEWFSCHFKANIRLPISDQ